MMDKGTFAYIGSWNFNSNSCGLGMCRYDEKTGKLEYIKTVMEEIAVGATYLDKKRNILYCVDERDNHPEFGLGGGGSVYALTIDPESGDLIELNHQPSYGSLPSYVAVDQSGKYLIATNFTKEIPITKSIKDEYGKYHIVLEFNDANTVLYRLNEDGSISDVCDMYKHPVEGKLPFLKCPHIHSVNMSPSGKLFAVCDMGTDKIYFFRINYEEEKLVVCGGEAYKGIPGAGPRYSAFHPTLPYFFINNEKKPVVCSFHYDEEGKLEHICTVDALPEDFVPGPKAELTDIRINSSGKYIYALIRGIHAVSVFEVEEKTGMLTKIQSIYLDGDGPRGCALSPDERFLLVANLTGGDVLSLAIGEGGKLTPTGMSLSSTRPANVTFFKA